MSASVRGRRVVLAAGVLLLVLGLVPGGGPGRVVGVAPAVAQEVLEPVAVDDPLRPLQWYLDRTRAPDAWSLTRGDPQVTVAVIDTGVDPEHPDLAAALWADPDTGAHGVDHLDGGSDTYHGPVSDWHGTAIAGILASRADDAFGIAGVAPRVSVMVHRIYGSTSETEPPNQASYALASEAIRDAAAAGADVILLTWGGTTPNAELVTAIQDAGVPVVAAAGNDGQDLSGSPATRRFPAMYRLPNLVTVAATDRDGRILANERVASNYGVRHVDIGAPGEELVSTSAGAEHALYEGTSFAAPQVAAALALGRSLAPGVSAAELVGTLVTTARRNAALHDRLTSGGVLDVAAFLRAVERPACGPEVPPRVFEDVGRSSAHVANIDCVAWYRVALGTGDDRFAPRRTITRGEMATLIARTLEAAGHVPVEPPDVPTFVDTAGTTHEDSIELLAATGITSGVGDGRFAPTREVTRGQMASFVVGAVELLLDDELVAERQWFDDVSGNVHERSILLSRELGITLGTSEPREFEPGAGMTREQMASFLARALDALGRQGVGVEPLS